MSFPSWVRQKFGGLRRDVASNGVDLVGTGDPLITVPKRVGLVISKQVQPWSITRLNHLFSDAATHPSAASFLAARIARHRLSSFWMSAPVDSLQDLYEGNIGALQQLLLRGPLVRHDLADDEKTWAEHLRSLLNQAEFQSEQINILLALIPYTRPGELSIHEPADSLPEWLLNDYIQYCQPDLDSENLRPAKLLEPSRDMQPLSERRGDSAMQWLRDEETLLKMLSLLDHYKQNSISDDGVAELAEFRAVLAQLWLDVEPTQLQTLFHTPVGDVTKAMIKAGIGRKLVFQQDQMARERLAVQARDFSQPNASGVIMAMLMFYPPDRVGFKSTNGLPEWFVDVLDEIL